MSRTAGRKERTKGRTLSKEEHALWTGVTRSVKPLRRAARKADEPKERDPLAASSAAVSDRKPSKTAMAKVAVKETAQEAGSKHPPLAPLERRVKQRVARGRQEIEARLDLHGYRQDEAHETLLHFLQAAQSRGKTLVLVITGKGRGSGALGAGILRRQVPLWLGLPAFRGYVVGFDEAAIAHGGEGALYVRIRKRR